jgi:hypothetical protein
MSLLSLSQSQRSIQTKRTQPIQRRSNVDAELKDANDGPMIEIVRSADGSVGDVSKVAAVTAQKTAMPDARVMLVMTVMTV